jgi:hypothetical protein
VRNALEHRGSAQIEAVDVGECIARKPRLFSNICNMRPVEFR